MDEPKARKGRQRPAAPTTPDPVEIAMEIAASGQTPADAAMAVLHANAALMHDQAGLTREQISLSREQIGLARNERFRNRIRAVRDMMLVLTILAVVGGAGSVVWSAHRSSGLVVEPFETPPGMAAGGVDGTVVASRLLDRLSAFQAATGSARAPATYANNWGDDLSVEVAQTGVSVGEVWRLLRQTLGQETRLSGDLTEANGRITLTTRVGAQPGIVVSGDADELDRVLDETARAVYRQTQPYRYAFWLRTVADADPDRRAVLAAERAATLAEMASSTDRTERLWGLVGQSVDARLAGDHELVIVLTNEALALDPTFQGARYNQVFSLELLGRTEEALGEALLFERGMRRRDPQYTESFRDQVGPFFRARIAAWLGDFGTVVEQRRVQTNLPDYLGAVTGARYAIASDLVALHDLTGARAALASADRSASPNPAFSALVSALIASEQGNPVSAAARMRLAVQLFSPSDGFTGWELATELRTEAPLILARGGDRAGAAALLSDMPEDCYPCLIVRGQIAALSGETGEAERLLVRATALSPSLPAAWQALGQARLDRGDRDGAIRAFEQAIERGPRWADPQKYWGDALMAQGDEAGAIRKYRAAADRAPRWGALHLAWGRALEAQGKRDQAREKYTEAARMDLSAADRAEVVRRLGAASRGS